MLILGSALVAFTHGPAAAGGEGEEPGSENKTESVEPWAPDEGIARDNIEFPYPDVRSEAGAEVTTRGMPAEAQKQFDVIGRTQQVFLDMIEKRINDLPDGSGTDREEAFKGQNFLIVMHIGAPMVLYPAVGVLGGGAIGLVVDSCTAGADVGVGTLAGVMGGGAVGTAAGVAHAGIAAVLLAQNTERLIEKYPDKSAVQTRGGEADWGRVDFNEAGAWEDLPIDDGDDGGDAEGEVTARSGEVVERGPRLRTRSRFAGPQESLYVHLVGELFGDKILAIADRWDRAPGLTAKQKAALRQIPFIRKSLQHIAYVKRNGRVAPGARPASPLSGYMKTVVKALAGDEKAIRQAWLDAVGLGRTRVQVKGGKLNWTTPSALRLVGAPAQVSVPLEAGSVKLGGKGGFLDPYVTVRFTPGPFDIRMGRAKVSGKNVVIGFTIKKGSKLCSATLKFKAGGPPKTLGGCSPRLSRDLTGSVHLEVNRQGFGIDRLTFGKHSLTLGLPSSSIGAVQAVVKKLSSPVKREIEKFVEGSSAWNAMMKKVERAISQNLLATIRSQAGGFGLKNVKDIRQFRIQGGKMIAEVTAQIIDSARLPFDRRQADAFKKLALARLRAAKP